MSDWTQRDPATGRPLTPLSDPYRAYQEDKDFFVGWTTTYILKSFLVMGAAWSPHRPNGAADDERSLSIVARGHDITGDAENNIVTGGTITSFTIKLGRPEGVSA